MNSPLRKLVEELLASKIWPSELELVEDLNKALQEEDACMVQSPCGCMLHRDCWAHTTVRTAMPTPPPTTTPKSEAQE